MILMEYLPHRIGRVIWWATLTIVGAFICIAVVGDAVVIWNWLRAGPA